MVEQGEILNVTGLKCPVLVISKSEYNMNDYVLVCPLAKEDTSSVFSQSVTTPSFSGYAYLDDVRKLNLKVRGCNPMGRLSMQRLILFCGIIQSLFDIEGIL